MSAEKAATGHKVKVHYTGKLASGETFDSSAGNEPLEFVLGSGQVIPGFEDGVTGLSIGEKKTIVISPDNAYGDKSDELIQTMPISEVPEGMEIFQGMQLELSDNEGNILPVVVLEVNDEFIVLDGNHPLAGQELHFEIELVEIA